MNLTTFRMTVAYISMAIFFAIPIIRTLMGSPFSITELLVSYAIAIGFAIYATIELQKYDEQKNEVSKTCRKILQHLLAGYS